MQAIGRQPSGLPYGAPVHYGRHRPEQITLYSLAREHAASFIAHTEAGSGSRLPRFIKDELEAFLACAMRTKGCPRSRFIDCGRDKSLASKCQRPRFAPPAVRAASC